MPVKICHGLASDGSRRQCCRNRADVAGPRCLFGAAADLLDFAGSFFGAQDGSRHPSHRETLHVGIWWRFCNKAIAAGVKPGRVQSPIAHPCRGDLAPPGGCDADRAIKDSSSSPPLRRNEALGCVQVSKLRLCVYLILFGVFSGQCFGSGSIQCDMHQSDFPEEA